MINRQNYEIWFLDYLEGALSEKQTVLLMRFLDKHPDLQAEFAEMELIQLPDTSLSFPDKNQLKRSVSKLMPTGDDLLLIASIENDLSKQEELILQKKLATSPQLRHAKKLFGLSKLKADLTVKYPNKKELKKGVIIPWRTISSVAAALLLLFALMFALKDEKTAPTPIVDTTQPKQTETEAPISPTNDKVIPNETPDVLTPDVIVSTPNEPKTPSPSLKPIISPKKKDNQAPQILKQPQNTVVYTPKKEKATILQPKAPTLPPPKPILTPELPEPKPILASNTSTHKAHAITTSSSHKISLNQPKRLLKSAIKAGIKKLENKENANTTPGVVVATIQKISKTPIHYNQKKDEKATRTSLSIGKFKFSRVKHHR